MVNDQADTLLSWDRNACQPACRALLLQRAGRLDSPFVPAEFDRLIGRKPGEPDLDMGGLALMLDRGFEVWEYSPFDGRRALTDYGYVARYWLEDGGLSQEDVDRYLPVEYPKLCRLWQHGIEIASRAGSRFQFSDHTLDVEGINQLLRLGFAVGYDEVSTAGLSHPSLLLRLVEVGKYEQYNPDFGIKVIDSADIAAGIGSGQILNFFSAYRYLG